MIAPTFYDLQIVQEIKTLKHLIESRWHMICHISHVGFVIREKVVSN